jgi:pimeloyl-ACP methyl ester carboxylesterase
MSGADFAYWAALRVARRKVVQFLGVPPELEARQAPAERERVSAIARSVLPLSMRLEGIRNDSAIRLGALPLERIQAPTLIITAEDDLFNTRPAAEHLAEHIPRAELVVLPDGGHLMVGTNNQVSGFIKNFLAEVRGLRARKHPLRSAAD